MAVFCVIASSVTNSVDGREAPNSLTAIGYEVLGSANPGELFGN